MHCPSIKQQEADTLSRLKTFVTDRKLIKGDVGVHFITLDPVEKMRRVGLYAWEWQKWQKRRYQLTVIYNVATWRESEKDVYYISVHDFIHEQAKDSNCRPASSTIGLQGSERNFDRNGFLISIPSIDGAAPKILFYATTSRPSYHLPNSQWGGIVWKMC